MSDSISLSWDFESAGRDGLRARTT